jgi:hypothetical protein
VQELIGDKNKGPGLAIVVTAIVLVIAVSRSARPCCHGLAVGAAVLSRSRGRRDRRCRGLTAIVAIVFLVVAVVAVVAVVLLW